MYFKLKEVSLSYKAYTFKKVGSNRKGERYRAGSQRSIVKIVGQRPKSQRDQVQSPNQEILSEQGQDLS